MSNIKYSASGLQEYHIHKAFIEATADRGVIYENGIMCWYLDINVKKKKWFIPYKERLYLGAALYNMDEKGNIELQISTYPHILTSHKDLLEDILRKWKEALLNLNSSYVVTLEIVENYRT